MLYIKYFSFSNYFLAYVVTLGISEAPHNTDGE